MSHLWSLTISQFPFSVSQFLPPNPTSSPQRRQRLIIPPSSLRFLFFYLLSVTFFRDLLHWPHQGPSTFPCTHLITRSPCPFFFCCPQQFLLPSICPQPLPSLRSWCRSWTCVSFLHSSLNVCKCSYICCLLWLNFSSTLPGLNEADFLCPPWYVYTRVDVKNVSESHVSLINCTIFKSRTYFAIWKVSKCNCCLRIRIRHVQCSSFFTWMDSLLKRNVQ